MTARMTKTELCVRTILAGWRDVTYADFGAFEIITATDPQGCRRVGHSLHRDVEDVARDLVALAEGNNGIQVEAPGLPESEVWHEGTMPGGREVRFRELHYELSPPPHDPRPEAKLVDPGGDPEPSGDGILDVEAEEVPADHGGVMVGARELDERRNALAILVDEACEDRIDARAAAGYADRLATLRSQYMGFKAGTFDPLSDDESAELAALEALDNWINRMRAYGAATRKALRTWPIEQLDAFDVAAADWPG